MPAHSARPAPVAATAVPGDQAAAELADRLHSTAIHLLRRLRRVDTRTGLSAPRLSALSVVVFGGPLTLGELAAAEQVKPPTMTRLVRALEARGLVTREADEHDGRVVRLSATTKGRKLVTEGRARRVQTLAKQVARLEASERATLEGATSVLARITAQLEAED